MVAAFHAGFGLLFAHRFRQEALVPEPPSRDFGIVVSATTWANCLGMILLGGIILDKWGIRISAAIFGLPVHLLMAMLVRIRWRTTTFPTTVT